MHRRQPTHDGESADERVGAEVHACESRGGVDEPRRGAVHVAGEDERSPNTGEVLRLPVSEDLGTAGAVLRQVERGEESVSEAPVAPLVACPVDPLGAHQGRRRDGRRAGPLLEPCRLAEAERGLAELSC